MTGTIVDPDQLKRFSFNVWSYKQGEIVYRGSDVQALWEAMDEWMGAMER